MINIFELHIGSIVWRNKKIIILEPEDFTQLEDDIKNDLIKPVKITDRFLKRNEFVKQNGDFVHKDYNYVINDRNVFTDDEYNYKTICESNYIHELQNAHIVRMHENFPIKIGKKGEVLMK